MPGPVASSGAATGHGDHVRLTVRLTPNGGRDCIDGLEQGADGQSWLKMRVSTVPEKGKANTAMIRLLARELSVSKSSIALIAGDTQRKKILRIDGDPEEIIKGLEALIRT